MARTVRIVSGSSALLLTLIAYLNALANACLDYATIANGTTNGKLKTTSDASFRIDGKLYKKAATDDLWDLSAQTTLSSGQYKAYWLYIDTAGAATIEAGTVGTSATLALQNLPVPSTSKSVFGVFVAGPSTNFANALSAQGTIHHGIPAGASYVPGTPSGSYGVSGLLTASNA